MCHMTLQGSQKLLYWNARHVLEWLKSVELDEYTGMLHNMGIHGAVMVGVVMGYGGCGHGVWWV